MAHKNLLLNRGSITYTEQKDKLLLVIMKQLFRNTQVLNMCLLGFSKQVKCPPSCETAKYVGPNLFNALKKNPSWHLTLVCEVSCVH